MLSKRLQLSMGALLTLSFLCSGCFLIAVTPKEVRVSAKDYLAEDVQGRLLRGRAYMVDEIKSKLLRANRLFIMAFEEDNAFERSFHHYDRCATVVFYTPTSEAYVISDTSIFNRMIASESLDVPDSTMAIEIARIFFETMVMRMATEGKNYRCGDDKLWLNGAKCNRVNGEYAIACSAVTADPCFYHFHDMYGLVIGSRGIVSVSEGRVNWKGVQLEH